MGPVSFAAKGRHGLSIYRKKSIGSEEFTALSMIYSLLCHSPRCHGSRIADATPFEENPGYTVPDRQRGIGRAMWVIACIGPGATDKSSPVPCSKRRSGTLERRSLNIRVYRPTRALSAGNALALGYDTTKSV